MVATAPVGPIVVVLPLPDRRPGLDLVDDPPGCGERAVSVGGGHGDDHRDVGYRQRTNPVPENHAADAVVAVEGLGGHLSQHALDVFFVGLVFELVDTGAIASMVSNRAGEGDHRPAVGCYRPTGGYPGIQRGVDARHPSPVGGRDRRQLVDDGHGGHGRGPRPEIAGPPIGCRATAATTAATTAKRLITIAPMGWDDDPEMPGTSRGPVPHPEDRLWRHPSEVAGGLGLRPVPAVSSKRAIGSAALAGACLAGAVLAFGAMWVVRPTRVVERVPVVLAASTTVPMTVAASAQASFAPNPVDTAALADELAPTMARVEAERSGRWVQSSGIWIDESGGLAVAIPAVYGATRLRVIAHSGDAHDAALLGIDPASGIAVLDVGFTDGRPASVADHETATGEAAAVAGASGTDAGTDSGDATLAGVIVRSTSVRASVGDLVLHDTIQLDRPLPSDAVGGALVDADGMILGVVIGNSTERDLATAVPARVAVSAAVELRDRGEVRRAWLGVQAVDLPPEEARALDVGGGARLTEVNASSPAAEAGLAVGDVVTAVGDRRVDDASDLVVALRAMEPGDEVTVRVRRPAGTTDHHIVLGG